MQSSLEDVAEALESAAARLESEAWPDYVELSADGDLRDPCGGDRIAELRELVAEIGASLAAVPAGDLPASLRTPPGLDPRGTFARVFYAGGRLQPGVMHGGDFVARSLEICRAALAAIGPIPPWRRAMRDLERRNREFLEPLGRIFGRPKSVPGSHKSKNAEQDALTVTRDVPPAIAPPPPAVVIHATLGEKGEKGEKPPRGRKGSSSGKNPGRPKVEVDDLLARLESKIIADIRDDEMDPERELPAMLFSKSSEDLKAMIEDRLRKTVGASTIRAKSEKWKRWELHRRAARARPTADGNFPAADACGMNIDGVKSSRSERAADRQADEWAAANGHSLSDD